MPEISLTLLFQFMISLIVPIVLIYFRQRRINGNFSVIEDLNCEDIKKEYAAVEKRLSLVMMSDKFAMDDIRLLCYNALGISIDDICISGVKRSCVVAVLLTARSNRKLLDLWKEIAKSRADLINDI